LAALDGALGDHAAPRAWTERMRAEKERWDGTAAAYTAPGNAERPSDAQVIGAVQRAGRPSDVVVCAAGGLPGELHKLWKSGDALGYHLEYGYSCMGYEIAGGLGVKMALPEREVIVMVGDGSYLMLNSEIATSVMLGLKLTIVLLDNGGYGCINRLQAECGGAPFN
ncbi:3D-(3,5/4)-trihydroxycyclohexane-1,2-dione acylhydrolase (decyclizing), partial [Salmonella enterica]|nr:3D-(3,5/4)-trihydroxycyclohexane-1,2-dione acylhydrolase (decyclizing) [Salmonella enterica]